MNKTILRGQSLGPVENYQKAPILEEETMVQAVDGHEQINGKDKRFCQADMWNIRKGARRFAIHRRLSR